MLLTYKFSNIDILLRIVLRLCNKVVGKQTKLIGYSGILDLLL